MLVTASTWLVPREVAACGCVPAPFPSGDPADGAIDVPIDVRPWVQAPVAAPADIVLEDSAGNAVDAEVHVSTSWMPYACYSGFAELSPREPLEKRERYTIRVVGEAANRVLGTWSFTTGETVLEAAPPELPDARLALVDASARMDTCVPGPTIRACVGSPGEGTLEVSSRQGDELTQRFFTNAATAALVLVSVPPDLCFELRRRDLAGRRSAPSTVCASDVPVQAETEDNFPSDGTGPNCNLLDGLLAPDAAPDTDADAGASTPAEAVHDGGSTPAPNSRAAGCSLAAAQPVVAWWLLPAMLALWLRRSKTPSRAPLASRE